VGSLICFLLWLVWFRGNGVLHWGTPGNRKWLLLRGFFGVAENASAFVAVRYLPLASANTIMFTTPFWTGLFAFLLLGQSWKWYDNLVTVTSFVGVVLVVRPAFLFGGDDDGEDDSTQGWHQWFGVGAALVFALTLTGANLVINSKVRDEHLNTVTAYMFAAVLLTVWVSFFWVKPTGSGGFFDHGTASIEFWLLAGIGALFVVFQFTRSLAFMLSQDASVVNSESGVCAESR
jgi:drug/metabolite transporter (DMT)-like permease